MTRILISLALVVGIQGIASAQDLGMAGAVSGAGQAMSQSLMLMQSGMMQQALQEQRAKAEREREERMYQYQREREDAAYRTQNAAVEDNAIRTLNRTHPGWRRVTAEGGAFRQWLATQPQSYQQLLLATSDPAIIGASIDQFRMTK